MPPVQFRIDQGELVTAPLVILPMIPLLEDGESCPHAKLTELSQWLG